jgi:hypothetical protein
VTDVIRGGGGEGDVRSFRKLGLISFAGMLVLALIMATDDSHPIDRGLVVAGLVGIGVLLLWLWSWALPRIVSSWMVEIGPDTIRWRGGWRRRDRVISRAPVVAARLGKDARFAQLGFYDAAGTLVARVPLLHFRIGRVMAALRRHKWPVPDFEPLPDSLPSL